SPCRLRQARCCWRRTPCRWWSTRPSSSRWRCSPSASSTLRCSAGALAAASKRTCRLRGPQGLRRCLWRAGSLCCWPGGLSRICERALRRRRRLRAWLLVFLEPRQHLVREQREIIDRILVREAAGMAHHDEVAHAAAIFAELDDLGINLIGRA